MQYSHPHPREQPQPSRHPAQQLQQDSADILLQQFPEASKLSREDMEEMLRNPAYLDAFFGTLPQTTAIYQEHRALLQQNEELAAKNMHLRERHEALKAETQAAFDDAKGLQQKWSTHIVPAQQEVYTRFLPNVQLARLRTAAYDQDRLSEHLVSSLSEGSINPDEFARQFKEVRRVYYRRNTHVEKFANGQVEWRE